MPFWLKIDQSSPFSAPTTPTLVFSGVGVDPPHSLISIDSWMGLFARKPSLAIEAAAARDRRETNPAAVNIFVMSVTVGAV